MEDVDGCPYGGKRAATSVRPKTPPREKLPTTPAANDDGPVLDARAESAITKALDALVTVSVPLLRAHLRRELAEVLPYLRAYARPRRARAALSPQDSAPVDDATAAKARALLDAHGVPRGRR